MAKILAIDDNKDNLAVLKAILSEAFPSSKLFFVQDGKKGLELCHTEAPDVILLDLVMPEIDGFEICAQLKSNDFLKNIPIIILTATKTGKENRIRALELGADAFLSKPIDEAELIAQIKVMLRIKESDDNKLEQNLKLSQLVLERTHELENELEVRKRAEAELQISLKSLEISKESSLNLMEDLKSEILERKIAEERIGNLNERLYLAKDAAKFGVWDRDLTTNRLIWDDIMYEIYGISKQSFPEVYDAWLNTIHPDDKEKIDSITKQAIKGEKEYNTEFRIIHPQGNIRYIKALGLVVRDSSNNPVRMTGINYDITETKRVEESLQESKSQLDLALRSAQMGVWFWDIKENKRFFDKHSCTILGIDPAVFNGTEKEFFKVIHPDDMTKVLESYSRTIKSNAFYEAEYRIVWPDGSIRFVNARGRLVLDENGNPSRLNGVLWDVTEQKLNQQAIQLSNQKMSLLFEQTPLGVIEWDNNFNVRDWNPSAERIFGFSKAEALGKHFSFITPKQDSHQVNDLALSLIKQKDGHRSTNENITKNGLSIICEWFNTTLVDSRGKTFGVASLVHDITERRQAEIALHKSNSQWDTTFNSIQDSIMMLDVNQRIIKYNKAFADQIGKQINGCKNPYCFNLVHGTDCPISGCPFTKMKNTREREILSYETEGRYYDCMVDPIFDDRGAVSGAVHIIYDITERKRVEIELIKSKEKAEESEKLKSVFLANMSHEIRTPLNAILGFSDFLGDPLLTEERRKKFVDIINNSGQQLLHIINDLIDISKLESKQLTLSSKECKINDMLTDTIEIYNRSESLQNKPDIRLILNLPVQQFDLVIKTDKIRLQQVLNNLITNAIKYTNEGFVEVGYEIKSKNNASFIEFFVKDTGIGIPSDKHEIIFERFRQVEENGYREGTGLGLSISKGIVDLMGGEIWFDSAVNKGTSFYFTLPYQFLSPNKKIEAVIESSGASLAYKTIIVAEDDCNSFKFVNELLSETKANIIHAENGQVLLDLLQKVKPDLVLLDINMPVKTGFQCMQEIKAKGYKFKVIAQTAYAMAEEREKCLNEGCDGYISKPYTKKTLLNTINAVLGF